MATIYDQASLVMIPSGYKDDKLYSVKPTDGSGDFTFSRDGAGASPATRVNASGLIEKGRTNLAVSSNDISTQSTYWTANQGGVTTQNSATAPDGSATASTITANGVNTYSGVSQTITMSGLRYTYSVYLKAVSGTPDIRLTCFDGSTFHQQDFTLSTSWERYSITFSPNAGTNNVYITSTQAVSWNAWGAQLELGQVPTELIETTTTAVSAGLLGDMPRLDYSGGATCPSLLLEPSRVNLAIQSEYIGSWNNPSGITITDNAAISPEGVQNAAYVQFASGNQYIRVDAIGSSATYTGSVYIKGTAGETIQLAVTGTDSGLKTLTGDWDRIEFTSTGASTHLMVHTFGGATARNIYVWGAQLESGSYPTSYIPTYGSASTRGADSCIKTGISSLIGQSEGVVFLDFIYKPVFDDANSQTTHRFSVSDGTYTNRITLYPNNSNGLGVLATGVVFTGTYSLTEGQRYKVALAYGTTSVVYINGVEAFGYVSGTPTGGYDRMQFADATNSLSRVFGSPVNQALLFDTRLTNAELAALTTI